ncbi:MAG: MFS transporter, partial [Cyanobacteria bacterium J06638_6]
MSSTTVGSLIGSVVKTATSSFQSLVGTATAAVGARAAGNQIIETAEATAAAVRKEITAAWNGEDLGNSLQEYLMTLRSPSLETEGLEAEFERLIQESNIASIADADTLNQLNRASFEKLVSSRTDLSNQEVKRIADRLYTSWRKALGKSSSSGSIAELVDYLKSASPGALVSEELGDRLDALLAEYRQQGSSQQSGIISSGLNTLIGIVMGRADLSDIDVEKISQRLKQVKHQVSDQVDTLSSQFSSGGDRYSATKADVETYLLTAYPWQLQPHRLQTEFWDVIYDPFADPGLMRQELMQINRAYFA